MRVLHANLDVFCFFCTITKSCSAALRNKVATHNYSPIILCHSLYWIPLSRHKLSHLKKYWTPTIGRLHWHFFCFFLALQITTTYHAPDFTSPEDQKTPSKIHCVYLWTCTYGAGAESAPRGVTVLLILICTHFLLVPVSFLSLLNCAHRRW